MYEHRQSRYSKRTDSWCGKRYSGIQGDHRTTGAWSGDTLRFSEWYRGTVLFGVTDKGKIIGQKVSDRTKRDIAEAIRRIEPFANIEISCIDIPDTDNSIIAFSA